MPDADRRRNSTILERGTLLLPAAVPATGPFQKKKMRWIGQKPAQFTGERSACISLYLALVTNKCLSLIGARGPIFVEGSFASNALYLEMLGAVSDRSVIPSDAGTGTSVGASFLVLDFSRCASSQSSTSPHSRSQRAEAPRNYARTWSALVN